MDSKVYRKKILELVVIILISLGIVFGVLCGMGTLTSGYHFVDDHEFLETTYMMKYHNKSVGEMIIWWLHYDFARGRFRPLYYTLRVFLIGIFGTNLILWSILRGTVVAASLVFLYYCGKMIAHSKVCAYLFALLSTVGFQSAAWWKLGPQEDFATLLFAIGFYLLMLWLQKGTRGFKIASLIIFIIMACYKESFILLLPFIIMFIAYDRLKSYSSMRDMWTNRKRLSDCKAYILTLGIVFISIILFIFLKLGETAGPGSNDESGLIVYYKTFVNEFATDLRWYKWTGIMLIAVLLTYWVELKKQWKEIILTMVFIIPQILVYARCGMLERYILPASIGAAMFFVLFVTKSGILSGKREILYYTIVIVMLALNARSMLVEADYFRYRGNSIETMLSTADAMMSNEDVKLVSCFSPNEESNITLKYWMLLHGHDQVYYYHEDTKKIDKEFQYDNFAELTGADNGELSIADADIVVMYNRDDRHYNHEPSLSLDGFSQIKCGTLTMFVRDEDGLNPQAINVRPSKYY